MTGEGERDRGGEGSGEVDHVSETLRHNERQLIAYGVPIFAIAGVVSSLLAPLGAGPVAAVVAFFGHGLVLRMVLVTPAWRELERSSRRLLVRWLTRAVFVAVGAWAYQLFSVPLVNVAAAPAVFAAITVAVGWYVRWSYRRDVRGAPIHVVEHVFLVSFGLIAILTLAVLVVAAAAAGLSISWLMEMW